MDSRTLIAVVHGMVLAGALGAGALAAQENTFADPLGGPTSAPILISPGGRGQEGEVGTSCPTFSWAAIDGATGYEVVVYESNGRAGAPAREEPILRIELPAGVSSWTPELREGLAPGRYAWAVAARTRQGGEPRWSQPALFRVTPTATTPAGEAPPRRNEGTVLELASVPAPPSRSSFEAPSLRNLTDEAYVPPVCGSAKFSDVPAGDDSCRWIEQLDRDGILTSCDGGANFCPDNPVTRKQLAAALGKSARGTATWHPAQGSNWLAPPVGNTITTVDNVGDVGQYTSITIGVDGLPIISYADITVEALKVAHCNDVACAGPATITTVDNDGNLGGFSSITIGSDGLPITSYYDATVDFENGIDRRALKVAHCNDVACSGQDETISFVHDPASTVGYYTSIAIGIDGLPIISYLDVSAGALVAAHCNDVACATPALITTLDLSGVATGATSIAISSDGHPIISYVDSGTLRMVRCTEFNCSASTSFALNSFGPLAGGTAITVGADGLPTIGYKVEAVGTNWIALAHCNDPNCFGGDETLSGLLDLSPDLALTIGADGSPITSYGDSYLRVLRCNDAACVGSDELPSPVGSGGQYSSITIGVDGLPIISFYDAAIGALKVAHCASVFCTPFFRRR